MKNKTNVKNHSLLKLYQKVEGAFQQLLHIQMKEGRFRKDLADKLDKQELNRFFANLDGALEMLQYCPNDLYNTLERAKEEV